MVLYYILNTSALHHLGQCLTYACAKTATTLCMCCSLISAGIYKVIRRGKVVEVKLRVYSMLYFLTRNFILPLVVSLIALVNKAFFHESGTYPAINNQQAHHSTWYDVCVCVCNIGMERLKVLVGWTYFHNLADTEFPLKTMGELTAIIKALNGSHDVSGFPNGMDTKYVVKVCVTLHIW